MKAPVALLALGLTACLPHGEPGIGERWVEGRGITTLAAPSGETPSRFVVFGRRRSAFYEGFRPYDVFAVAAASDEPRLVASGVETFGYPSWDGAPDAQFAWDARDRLWLSQFAPSAADPFARQVSRVDLRTGEMTNLGAAFQIQAARDGKTVLIGRTSGGQEVHDVDDHVQSLGSGVGLTRFVGLRLFFTNPGGLGELPLPPLLPPRRLVDRVRAFWPVPGHADAPLLLVDAADPAAPLSPEDPSGRFPSEAFPNRQMSLVRVAAGAAPPVISPLAQGRFAAEPALNDEGDRIALLDRTDAANELRVRVFDLSTGAEQTATFVLRPPVSSRPGAPGFGPMQDPGAPGPRRLFVRAVFRPGARDLWIFQEEYLAAIFSGGVLQSFASNEHRTTAGVFSRARIPGREIFTSDGRFWMFQDSSDGRLRIGSPDDPFTSDALVLPHTNTARLLDFQEFEGGKRMLVFSDLSDARDLDVVDLDTRRIVRWANNVGQAVVGQQRVIAIVDKLSGDQSPGRLVSIDLASGAQLRLGDNVTQFTLSRVCATCDPTAPGIELQYIVQARLPYEHDGLWKATLP